jgi:hypothetical protein
MSNKLKLLGEAAIRLPHPKVSAYLTSLAAEKEKKSFLGETPGSFTGRFFEARRFRLSF